MKSKKQQQLEKFALVGQLTGNIAHELRNPISVIQITLENMKMAYGVDDVKQQQFDRIERSLDRILDQVGEILDFVRARPIVFEETKFSKVLFESLDSIKIPDDIKLVLPKNDVDMHCDLRQFAMVLNNLILNGIQAMDNVGTIEIILIEKNNEIIIQISDSGNGISDDNLDKIFDPLFTTKQHGTGLGLVSVKSIIESHGGIILVTMNPTIFTITFPKIQQTNNF